MKNSKIISYITNILLRDLDETDKKELRFVQPFLWIVEACLVFLYFTSIYYFPTLREPSKLIPFTILMAIHALIHWNVFRLVQNQRSAIIYLFIQGLLAFTINILGQNFGLVIGLYMILIGEAIGTFDNYRITTPAVLFFMVLSGINYAFLEGWETLYTWLLTMLPLTFFAATYVILFKRQAEARLQTQQLLTELEDAHLQLTEYATQVEELTIINERQRMARELHDTLAQGLAGVILQLEAADSYLANENPIKAQAITQQAMERARGALTDARRAIKDLRENQFTGTNLVDVLHQEVDRFTTATGIPCELDLSIPDDLPDHIGEITLRAISEGLMNIARHANANEVKIIINCDDENKLEIKIQDNGCGFNPEESIGKSGHYGLLGMRERTRLSRGELEVISSPGSGTTLNLTLPCEPHSM
jgi:NarL family two-component system sensor histidine kinase YdfH